MNKRSNFIILGLIFCLFAGLMPMHAAESKRPNLLMIGKRGRYMELEYLNELNAHGFDIKSLSWEEISPEVLREFNAVLITGFHDVMTKTRLDEQRQRWIDDYMRAGGGVLVFLNTAGAYNGDFHHDVIRWLKSYQLDFYIESVEDKKNEINFSPKNISNRRGYWADKIEKHPVTEGVKSLLFPSGWGGHSEVFTVPVEGNATQWKPLVWSGPDAVVTSAKNVPKDQWREDPPAGPFPLMAVRSVDKGRLAVIGISPVWVAWTPYHWSFGGSVMKNGEDGRKSDFWKLLENTYSWLSEPSLKTDLYGSYVALRPPIAGDTPPVDWTSMDFPPAPEKWYKGLAGAHSALSTGKGTVKEWITEAKANGFDFLIFTEDLAHMSKEKWEKLQSECEALSDDTFRAYAGMEYESEAGIRGFIPWGNTRPWLFDKGYLTQDGKKTHVGRGNNADPGDHSWRKGGQLQIYLDSKCNGFFDLNNNAVPYWDLKGYTTISAFTYENEKMLEENIDAILHLNASNINPAPYALDMLYDPADLAKAGKDGRPFLLVPASPDPRIPVEATMKNMLDRMAIAEATVPYRMNTGSYRGWHGPVASQGPKARLMFRGGYKWKGNEFPRYWIDRHMAIQDEDWFMPSWYRTPFCLDAESDVGLAEIVVYDGEEVVRRFKPNGAKQFRVEFVLPHDRNHHLAATITDVNGHKALTREVWMEQQQNLYNYCGDRVNAPYLTYSPVHGQPYHRVFRQHRDVTKETLHGRGGDEIRHFYLDLVSPDVYLSRYRTEWIYQKNEIHDRGGWHNWAPHYPRDDYHFEQRAYGWYWKHGKEITYDKHASQKPCWDGYQPRRPLTENQVPDAELSVFDNILEPLKPLDLDENGFFAKTVITSTFPAETGIYAIVTPDGKSVQGKFSELKKALTGSLTTGSIVSGAAKPDAVAGDSILWEGDMLAYKIDKQKIDGKIQGVIHVGLKPADKNRKGEKFVWRFQRINRRVSVDQLLNPKWFKVSKGTVDGLQLCELHVQAEDRVAELTIKETAFDTNAQPIVIHGVNTDASCYLYDKNSGRIRPIGSWDGKAFVQIPGSQKDAKLVIGNLIYAEQPLIQVDTVPLTDRQGDSTGEWMVNVHNPTDTEVEVNLQCPAEFDLIKQRKLNVTLSPYSSKKVLWR